MFLPLLCQKWTAFDEITTKILRIQLLFIHVKNKSTLKVKDKKALPHQILKNAPKTRALIFGAFPFKISVLRGN